jgi:hypothetical protein
VAAARPPGRTPILRDVALLDAEGCRTDCLAGGDPLTVEIHYELPAPLREPRFAIFVRTAAGERLFALNTQVQHGPIAGLPRRGVVRCRIPALPLVPGLYTLSFACSSVQEQLDYLEAPLSLAVEAADYFGTGRLPLPEYGRFLVPARWELPGAPTSVEEASRDGD